MPIALMLMLIVGQPGALPLESDIGLARAEVSAPDTIVVGGSLVRLWGVSLARSQAPCPDYGTRATCAEGARWELNHLIKDHVVRCRLMGAERATLPAGICEVQYDACYGTTCTPNWRDLSKELISAGTVIQNRAESVGRYDEAETAARLGRTGLWAQSSPYQAPSP